MPKFTKQDIFNISKLAKIELKEDEIKKFEEEISSILDFVSQLKEVDTKNIDPLSQVTGLENVMEEDKVIDGPGRDKLLKNVPQKDNGFIKVKKVFENSDNNI